MIPKLFDKNQDFYNLLINSGCSIEYTGRQLRRFHITSKIDDEKELYIFIYTNDNGKYHASGRFVNDEELIYELQEILSNAYDCAVGFKLFDVKSMKEVFPVIDSVSLLKNPGKTFLLKK